MKKKSPSRCIEYVLYTRLRQLFVLPNKKSFFAKKQTVIWHFVFFTTDPHNSLSLSPRRFPSCENEKSFPNTCPKALIISRTRATRKRNFLLNPFSPLLFKISAYVRIGMFGRLLAVNGVVKVLFCLAPALSRVRRRGRGFMGRPFLSLFLGWEGSCYAATMPLTAPVVRSIGQLRNNCIPKQNPTNARIPMQPDAVS